ncbi:hypothetical protein A4H97_28185 [Niastella yeongjuensis]|uniref:Uncharacterized protein n=1 Tax=Niastella yeongjuensis TaxID=354355 RepID=A0A1V9EUR3_9BACT|nr:hypothetical protein [Niastella yeongjuensis]OQP49772.1 hypothetical protein A4H97_28185 [Niastella yeongjuensis]SEP40454.1 hypothetical protein SAMN05660816_05797 [Niastella yeongjuensis]
MDRLTHVYDCTGNLIFFDQFVLECQDHAIKLSQDQYLQSVETLSSPTLIFELNKNCPTRYYYRGIGLEKPLIIGVQFNNGMWAVKEFCENASVSFLLTLLKQRLLDGQVTIYVDNEIEDNALGNQFFNL